jgi:hypothetical protein
MASHAAAWRRSTSSCTSPRDIDVDPVQWPVQELNEAPNGIYTVLMDANHLSPVNPGGIYVFTISVQVPTTGDRGTVVIPFQFPVN